MAQLLVYFVLILSSATLSIEAARCPRTSKAATKTTTPTTTPSATSTSSTTTTNPSTTSTSTPSTSTSTTTTPSTTSTTSTSTSTSTSTTTTSTSTSTTTASRVGCPPQYWNYNNENPGYCSLPPSSNTWGQLNTQLTIKNTCNSCPTTIPYSTFCSFKIGSTETQECGPVIFDYVRNQYAEMELKFVCNQTTFLSNTGKPKTISVGFGYESSQLAIEIKKANNLYNNLFAAPPNITQVMCMWCGAFGWNTMLNYDALHNAQSVLFATCVYTFNKP